MPLKRNQIDVTSDINVTPLVDVMLVLLIIFMVITPMLQHGVEVNLSKTHNPVPMQDADKEDAVLVAVTPDGRIFMGNDLVSGDQLTDQVQKAISKKLNKTVYIKADARAQFRDVADVVDDIRAAGVDQVAMLTQKVDAQGRPVNSTAAGPAQ